MIYRNIGAFKQTVINAAQLELLRKIVTTKTGQANANDSNNNDENADEAMREMQAVFAIYEGDFRYLNATFEERAEDITHKCAIVCRPSGISIGNVHKHKDSPWLEVCKNLLFMYVSFLKIPLQVLFSFKLSYPSTPPLVSFLDTFKCTVGTLLSFLVIIIIIGEKIDI